MVCSFVSKKTTFDLWAVQPGGVRGIKLRDGDEVVGMEIVEPGQEILVVTEKVTVNVLLKRTIVYKVVVE